MIDFQLDRVLEETPVFLGAYTQAVAGEEAEASLETNWNDLEEETDGNGSSQLRSRFHLTDVGNAKRFVAQHGSNTRFCNPWGKWLGWDNKRWGVDNTQEVSRLARQTTGSLYEEAAFVSLQAKEEQDEERKAKLVSYTRKLLAHAQKSESAPRLKALLTLAQMDIPVLPEELDSDLWRLNVANGTIDLRTGQLHPHRQSDLLTKITSVYYDPSALCPAWEQFLDDIMAGKREAIEFLWRAFGYSLTGDTRENCLFLLHGDGANGKTTFLETLRAVVGDYGKQAEFTTFLHKERDNVRNDIADLKGARFVVASEVDEGKRLSESLIKSLTGRETLKARFLFQEFFEFQPQLKLWLASNHRPVIRGTDLGIWRRIRLIPFLVKFKEEEQDKELPAKLRKELPGILAWAVRGCLAWQKDGLLTPEIVNKATADYRAEMDTLGQFLEACCVQDPRVITSASDLYTTYKQWAEQGGEHPITQTAFGRRLGEKGFEKSRNSTTDRIQWKGIGLKI